jgi:hypothetical protein
MSNDASATSTTSGLKIPSIIFPFQEQNTVPGKSPSMFPLPGNVIEDGIIL